MGIGQFTILRDNIGWISFHKNELPLIGHLQPDLENTFHTEYEIYVLFHAVPI